MTIVPILTANSETNTEIIGNGEGAVSVTVVVTLLIIVSITQVTSKSYF